MFLKFYYTSILSFLTVMLFFGFFHHFDITDEGYHLYHSIFGLNTKNTFMAYQIIPQLIGNLFDHQLIGFRFLTFSINTILALYVALAAQRFLKNDSHLMLVFSLLGSFNFYVFITSFDYNASTVFSIYLWLGSVLFLYAKETTSRARLYTLTSLIALAGAWAILSKFTMGIPLVIATPIILLIINYLLKKPLRFALLQYVLIQTLVLVASYCLINVSHPSFWADYWYNFQSFLNMPDVGNSLPKLLLYYFLSTGKFFLFLLIKGWGIAFILCLLYFNQQLQKQKFLYAGYCLYFILIGTTLYGLLRFTPFNPEVPVYAPGFELTKFWPAIVLLGWLTQYKYLLKDKRLLVFLLLCVGSTALTPLGTNTNFMSKVSLLGAPYAVMLIVLIFHLKSAYPELFQKKIMRFFTPAAFASVSLFVGTAIMHEKILNAPRNAQIQYQTELLDIPSYIEHIRITPDLKNTLNQIYTSLNSTDFNPKKDRIFAYADTPGYLAPFGYKSFGESWVITDYSYSDARACQYVSAERPREIRYVYILQSAPFTETVEKCLFSKIETTPDTSELFTIDAGYHYRSRKNHTLTLLGPFKMKLDAVVNKSD